MIFFNEGLILFDRRSFHKVGFLKAEKLFEFLHVDLFVYNYDFFHIALDCLLQNCIFVKKLCFVYYLEKWFLDLLFLINTVETFHAVFIRVLFVLFRFIGGENFHFFLLGDIIFLNRNEQIEADRFNFKKRLEKRLIFTFRKWWCYLSNIKFDTFFDILTFELY